MGTYEDKEWHGRILHEYEWLAGAKVEQLAFFISGYILIADERFFLAIRRDWLLF